MASRECVVEVFAYLAGAYQQKFQSPTQTDMRIWHDILEDVTDDQAIEACRAWCRSDSEWPPTAGQLRMRALGERRTYADRSHRPFDHDHPAIGAGSMSIADGVALARRHLRAVEGEA